VLAFGNTVPTGLERLGRLIFVAQAGPVPHLPENGRVVAFGPLAQAPIQVAAGARLLVDVQLGPRHTCTALAQGYRGVSVERGLAGAQPGSDAPFVMVCRFLFETVDDFGAAFTPHAEALQADIKGYTDIAPVIQIGAAEITERRDR
jgi:uncharacterized protein (TIGR02118 family)